MAGNDKVPELSGKEFEDFTKSGLVLVDFFADWCMPCVMMSPILDELSEKLKGKVKIGKVNVEENSALAEKFEVRSIPCMVLMQDSKEIDRMVGSLSADELEGKLTKIASA